MRVIGWLAAIGAVGGCSTGPRVATRSPTAPVATSSMPATAKAPPATAAVPRPAKDFLPDAMIALRDDGDEPWRYRAHAHDGTVTAHGRVLNRRDDLYVVKIERDRLRVVVADGPLRLLEWLPRATLLPVVRHQTATATRPDAPVAADTGVWLDAGHPVESPRDGWWHVTNDERSVFELDAWVATEDVADFFEFSPPIGRDPFGFRMFERQGFLPSGATIRARPADDAPVLATVATPLLVTLTREADDWVAISDSELDVHVHGLVRRQDVTVRLAGDPDLSTAPSHRIPGGPGRARRTPSPRPTPTIPKGTCIFADNGERIGMVAEDMTEPATAAPDGRSRLSALRNGLWFRPCFGDFDR